VFQKTDGYFIGGQAFDNGTRIHDHNARVAASNQHNEYYAVFEADLNGLGTYTAVFGRRIDAITYVPDDTYIEVSAGRSQSHNPIIVLSEENNEYLVVYQSIIYPNSSILGAMVSDVNHTLLYEIDTLNTIYNSGFQPSAAYNTLRNEFLVIWTHDLVSPTGKRSEMEMEERNEEEASSQTNINFDVTTRSFKEQASPVNLDFVAPLHSYVQPREAKQHSRNTMNSEQSKRQNDDSNDIGDSQIHVTLLCAFFNPLENAGGLDASQLKEHSGYVAQLVAASVLVAIFGLILLVAIGVVFYMVVIKRRIEERRRKFIEKKFQDLEAKPKSTHTIE